MKQTMGMMAAGVLAGTMFLASALPVQAAESVTETAAEPDAVTGATEAATESSAASVADAGKETKRSVTDTKNAQPKVTRTWEVQAEYLEGRFFDDRHIDDYNLHIYQKNREVGSVSVWYGLTLSRPVGYTTEDKIYRDSEAVGLGPSAMIRWERPLAGKLHGSIDGTGSLMFYNQAHPGDGRAPHLPCDGRGCREPRLHVPPFVERAEASQSGLQWRRLHARLDAYVLISDGENS